MQYAYPASIENAEGTVIIRFPDFPEAITEGPDRAAALREAVDLLDTAILFRLKDRGPLPPPSALRRGSRLVAASPSVAAKAAFIQAFAEARLSQAELAETLGVGATEVRRMLDPDHVTKIDRLNEGLAALGQRLVVAVMAA